MEDYVKRIDKLLRDLDLIVQDIARETEYIKSKYLSLASGMPNDQNYFLNGIQAGSVVKSYLLTNKGIEVPGEATIPIPDFIDSVLRFANHPNKKIEVLKQLATHIENIG